MWHSLTTHADRAAPSPWGLSQGKALHVSGIPWTPSPHCPPMPHGRPPVTVPRRPVEPSRIPRGLLPTPENSLQLWHQSGGTEAALLPSREEELFLTGPTVLPRASLSSGSWCSRCSPRCADACAALQCACSSVCAVWLGGVLHSSSSSLCLQEMILAGWEIVGLACYSHV